MNPSRLHRGSGRVSAGCHINDVMNWLTVKYALSLVSAGCHINDVMNVGAGRHGS